MNVLVRKISLNRLENLQKLPVYGKSPHQRQLRGEACILHYGMSRQKQIPNLSTLANLPVFKKGELASKKKKKKKKLLLSKQLAELFERRILSKYQSGFILGKAMKLEKKKPLIIKIKLLKYC